MQLDLLITLQRMKVKELNAREKTLNARGQVERFKLNQMIEEFRGIDNGKKS